MSSSLLFFLIQLLILQSFAQTIPNCEEFDPNTNTCTKCEDKYFPLFHNMFCIPCDDKDYGQVGCGGNCDASKYENDRFVYCERNRCKEGYYELEGLCLKCGDFEAPGCKKCHNTLTQIDDQIDYQFTCEECLSNEYKMDEFGICQKCQMDGCLECIYTNDYSNTECLQCASDYYLTSEKTCERCYQQEIPNGYCWVCSDDPTNLESANCYCDNSYLIDKNKACSFCIEDCSTCISTEEDEAGYCLNCNSGKILYNNQCLRCPENCATCVVDSDNTDQKKCVQCYSGYFLLNENCLSCGSGCEKCILDESNNIECLQCQYERYALNPDKTCTSCSSLTYLGEGCLNCKYNEIKTSFECLECEYYYDYNDRLSHFSYIKNEFKCLYNLDSTQVYLYGCLEANFIENDVYECLKCKKGFLPLINDKTCKPRSLLSLSDYCLEAINIGDESNPIYSCNQCNNETVLLTGLNGISDCAERSGNLAYCLKAKEEDNGNNICTECVSLAHLTEENSECQCDYDSFGFKNLFCYKCDDEYHGNPGCEIEEGCDYRPQNEQINCHKCRSDYYEFTYGQCLPCSIELEFCNKCHLDENSQFICDGCLENFIYNKYEKVCELNCQEYPDISPGCVVCNEEYKSKRKCNACKPGYFKLENESCVNCRTKEYGGPACDRCAKNENDGTIFCVSCEGQDKVLNSKGKCYFAPIYTTNECSTYKFKGNGNEQEIVCAFCNDGFYLDSNGNCVNFLEYLEIKDKCQYHHYQLGKLSIAYFNDNNNINIEYYVNENEFYVSANNAHNFNETVLEYVNSNLRKIDHLLTADCQSCNSGYLLNSENQCISETIEQCSIISMIKDNNIYYHCQEFCQNKQYPLLLLNVNNESDEPSYVTIPEIYTKVYESKMFLSDIASLIHQTLCIDNSENEDLKNCLIAKYLEQENKYACYLCQNDYFLYEETNKCVPFDNKYNCVYENIGTEINPILSCKKCRPKNFYFYYNEYFNYNEFFEPFYFIHDDNTSDYIMAKEGNVNICVYPELELENCLSATVDTTYATNKYNCTTCLINHLPYYSKFYESYICQSIFGEIKTSQTFNTYNDYSIETTNGACPDDTYFSPDGKYCYQCNSYLGMYGCKGKCSFSLERNNPIKCLDGCIEGYIEEQEGICRRCYEINRGCEKCHYEEYPPDYFGIKRKRKFVCDSCDSDFYIMNDDKCTPCSYIESYCDSCEIKDNEFKCKNCNYNSFFEEGHCVYCYDCYVLENKCIKCNDKNGGGMEGCQSCYNNHNRTACIYCEEGYILLKNNETCLKISENPELIKHSRCRDVILKNNKFQCLECKDFRYSVLNINDESMCIYLPELNGYREDYFYYDDPSELKNPDINQIYQFYYNNYILFYFDHCSEVINLGSAENPLYSCLRCYDYYDLFKEENTNISYCIDYSYNDNYYATENCKEKKFKIIDKTIKLTCTSCFDENIIPVYHEIDKVNYCIDSNDTSCMAKNCKMCKLDDNYFCEICENEKDVVNEITGACMEKIESVPDITWKDIFRLELNSEKEINGKTIKGPKLNLRGETNSQINSGHAFIIYLIFKLKQPLIIRNLQGVEDTIRIKAICEIIKGVEESQNEMNIVDYECIGDSQDIDLNGFVLDNIEVGEDDTSNLKQLASTKNLLEIENGPTIEFKMDIIKNQTSNNYNFDFTLNGKIDDNNLENTEIKEKFKMNEIDESSDCTFRVGQQRNANLNCKLNIKEYQDIKTLSFKTTKIEYNNEYNISFLNLDQVYLISEPESEDGSNGKKIGLIIGIVVGGVVVIAISTVIIYFCIRRKKLEGNDESVKKFQPSS
jgi:hypothetical protein